METTKTTNTGVEIVNDVAQDIYVSIENFIKIGNDEYDEALLEIESEKLANSSDVDNTDETSFSFASMKLEMEMESSESTDSYSDDNDYGMDSIEALDEDASVEDVIADVIADEIAKKTDAEIVSEAKSFGLVDAQDTYSVQKLRERLTEAVRIGQIRSDFVKVSKMAHPSDAMVTRIIEMEEQSAALDVKKKK